MSVRTWKDTARAVATGNITLSGAQTVDGVALVAGDYCLCVGQTSQATRGKYRVLAGAWKPAYDHAQSLDSGAMHVVTVSEGSAGNRGSVWACTTKAPITLGTTALTYTRIAPDYLARNPWEPGLLGSTVSRPAASGTLIQTSGTLYLHGGIVLEAGITYSAANAFFSTAGTLVTHTWAGLVRLSDRVLLAVSADNTAAPGADTYRTWTFGAALTPDVDTPVYVAILLAATTTVPTLAATPANVNSALFGAVPILAGTSNTGLTTPQAVTTAENALTAITQCVHAYLT